MATPVPIGSPQSISGVENLTGLTPGDTLILVAYSTARTSNQKNWRGSHGNAGLQGAGAFQAISGAWQTYINGSIVGGTSHRVRVFVGVVPQGGEVTAFATVGGSGKYGVSTMTAHLYTFRNVGGVGATAKGSWRLPATGPQSVGFYTRANTPPPPGAIQLRSDTYIVPASGSTIGSNDPQDRLLAIELLGTTNPAPPVQLEPADGSEVANGEPVEFSWAHQPSQPGGSQDAYRFRLTLPPDDDPTFRWWDGIGLVSSETDIVSTSSHLELPASVVGVDASLGWSVATREGSTGEWSDYSPVWSVSSGEPPTVTVTGPDSPVHNTMRPVITWEAEPRPGEVLVQYQVRLADEDGAFVFDSGGQQGNPGQHAVPALSTFINGHEYTPWVRVRQTRGAWSAWTSGAPFPVTWDAPQTPVVSAAPGRHGVEITVEDPTIAHARQDLLDALAAYTTAPAQWSHTEPSDTGVVWVDPGTGEARQWSDYGPGPVTNLVTNPRGRNTSGTVVVREDVPAAEAVLYEDPETSPDPDLSVEWQGTPGDSDADLVAPKPVGWETIFGSIYYSESRDALALLPNPSSGNVYPVGDTDVSPPTPFTRVFTLWTDTGNSVQAAGGSQNLVTVNDGETLHTVFETSATGFLSIFVVDEESPVNTIYIRAAIIPGEYAGPYFDGHTLGASWDGDPDDSTSTYPGPHWALVEDPDVVAAGQAYELAVGGVELAAEVQRADGDDWVPVALAAQGGTATDVLAPYGQTVTYRARTSNTIADVTVYSEWAESGPVHSRDRYGYLADAADPARWVRFKQAHATGLDAAPQEIETRAGLGDTRAMVDKGPILGRRGMLTARTDTIGEAEELLDMLQSPLLVFRRPAEQRYAGPSQVWQDRGTIVFTVNDPPREEPLSGNYPLTVRLHTFGWVEQ